MFEKSKSLATLIRWQIELQEQLLIMPIQIQENPRIAVEVLNWTR